MAKALPNATFVQFDESAHTATLEEPQRFNRVVLKFLAQP
jgi:pimeloyl-ACP methyl ester carboxylesterase